MSIPFLAKPHQTQPRILKWAAEHPELIRLDSVRQYVGFDVYAVTVTDTSVPDEKKTCCLFTQPHAHEPATTAGMMDFLCQVIEGRHLDGSPADLPREEILRNLLLSIIPDANPDGRSRSPELYWDGSKWSNDEFWYTMRGIDPRTLKMWERFDEWDLREQSPRPLTIGIVYEQVGPFEYVEPNRSHRSAYFRLIHHLLGQRRYHYLLDLHQTEFERSAHNCMVILPILQPELPEAIRATNQAWGEEIVAAWAASGASPLPEVAPLNYTGVQAEYFRRSWRDIVHTTSKITVEIQNNNPRTPPQEQVRLMDVAMRVTVERALREGAA